MIAFTVIGIMCVGTFLGLIAVGLLEHVATEWKARQYRRAWDGTVAGRVSQTPIYDAVAAKYASREAARDLTDESLAEWLGGER